MEAFEETFETFGGLHGFFAPASRRQQRRGHIGHHRQALMSDARSTAIPRIRPRWSWFRTRRSSTSTPRLAKTKMR
jgi:hypothetical protein